MAKKLKLKQNDPQFNLRGGKQLLNARQTLNTRRIKTKKLNTKRWSVDQQKKYLFFVKKNSNKFQNTKQHKIFTLMAKQVKTRSPEQCKTHHAKLFIKYQRSIVDIIKNLEQRIIQQQDQYLLQKSVQVSKFSGELFQNNGEFLENKESLEHFQESVQNLKQVQNSYFQREQEEIFNVLDLQ